MDTVFSDTECVTLADVMPRGERINSDQDTGINHSTDAQSLASQESNGTASPSRQISPIHPIVPI